jgi:hypothetical protein
MCSSVLAACNTTQMVILELVVVEVVVALNAAEFSCDLGLQQICLEGDTLQIVNDVKANERN